MMVTPKTLDPMKLTKIWAMEIPMMTMMNKNELGLPLVGPILSNGLTQVCQTMEVTAVSIGGHHMTLILANIWEKLVGNRDIEILHSNGI